MIIETKMSSRDPEIETERYKVGCVHELPHEEFQYFKRNPLKDYSFISDHNDDMYRDGTGTIHCLLVLDEGSDNGILVRSGGYSYARYHAFLPNARTAYIMDQYPTLKNFVDGMQRMVDRYVKEAVACQTDGSYRIAVDEAAIKSYGLTQYYSEDFFVDMLLERSEINDAFAQDGMICVAIEPNYALKDDDSKLHRILAADVEIICAQHVLWLNEMNGERADFSGCLLEDLNLSYKNLNGALFNNAKLVNVNLHGAEMGTAGFNGATLRGCNLTETEAEQANFRDAKLLYSSMDRAIFTDSNFSGVQFHGSSMNGGSFKNCCFEGADLKCMTMNSVNMDKCIYDEQAWMRAMYPVHEQKI